MYICNNMPSVWSKSRFQTYDIRLKQFKRKFRIFRVLIDGDDYISFHSVRLPKNKRVKYAPSKFWFVNHYNLNYFVFKINTDYVSMYVILFREGFVVMGRNKQIYL